MSFDSKKPIVFLNIDGVLNSLASTLGSENPHTFDATACKLMERLVLKANAQVVISSGWRVGRTVGDLMRVLWEQAAIPGVATRIIGVTPQLGKPRGVEIDHWLQVNRPNDGVSFVIVDDNADMLESQAASLVQTRQRDGFTVKDYLAALRIIAPMHKDVVDLNWYATDRLLSSLGEPTPIRG